MRKVSALYFGIYQGLSSDNNAICSWCSDLCRCLIDAVDDGNTRAVASILKTGTSPNILVRNPAMQSCLSNGHTRSEAVLTPNDDMYLGFRYWDICVTGTYALLNIVLLDIVLLDIVLLDIVLLDIVLLDIVLLDIVLLDIVLLDIV